MTGTLAQLERDWTGNAQNSIKIKAKQMNFPGSICIFQQQCYNLLKLKTIFKLIFFLLKYIFNGILLIFSLLLSFLLLFFIHDILTWR